MFTQFVSLVLIQDCPVAECHENKKALLAIKMHPLTEEQNLLEINKCCVSAYIWPLWKF